VFGFSCMRLLLFGVQDGVKFFVREATMTG
jgi:hypothetical protein